MANSSPIDCSRLEAELKKEVCEVVPGFEIMYGTVPQIRELVLEVARSAYEEVRVRVGRGLVDDQERICPC